ncbi:MAG: DMP19 family protein [Bacteroidaceae bacterium]|nr:DMP19 family protein [Bacteroidaceae bacterium]
MEEEKFQITQEELDAAWNASPLNYIEAITDAYLNTLDGQLTEYNMDVLTANQHTLLAYRYILDEVMEGGFIQLIQNGYGPYVLDGPIAMMMKKHWELVDFGKFMYEVKKEYHLHKAELEADLNEEQFMALYEQQEKMNELGDEFLDKYQEIVTPSIADYVRKNEEKFVK